MKKQITATVTLFILLVGGLNGFWVANEGDCGYEEGCGVESSSTKIAMTSSGNRLAIRSLIKNGAVLFLESQSLYNNYLREIELGNEINHSQHLQEIIQVVEQAKTTYYELEQLTKSTKYNLLFIQRLKAFNYDAFMEERGLHRDVFEKVKSVLMFGNLNGVYSQIAVEITNLSDKLNVEKASVNVGGGANIPNLFMISQEFSDLHMYGLYTSQVFIKIK